MSPHISIKILLALAAFCITCSTYATSASTANIDIEPVTYTDNGVVLFKAYRHINYWGAAVDREFGYFWIAVSADGIWDEVTHKILKQPGYSRTDDKKLHDKEEREERTFWRLSKFYDNENVNGPDWANPPKTLLPLIKKYGFKPRPGFNKNEGQGAVTWSSKGICINDKCTQNPVPQRTLGNKSSSKANTTIDVKGKEMITVESAPIQNIFYHAGVALFRNGNYKVVDGKYEATDGDAIGAEFDFNKSEKNGEMIDYNYVDAISVLHHH